LNVTVRKGLHLSIQVTAYTDIEEEVMWRIVYRKRRKVEEYWRKLRNEEPCFTTRLSLCLFEASLYNRPENTHKYLPKILIKVIRLSSLHYPYE
jgi:hypothetical protein